MRMEQRLFALPWPDYQGIGSAEFAVVTGVVHGTTTGSYNWSIAAGFGAEHQVVKAILVSPGNFGTGGLKPVTEFLEVDFNPATDETLYACWLEY